MLDIHCSSAGTNEYNKDFNKSSRRRGEGNVAWVKRHYPAGTNDAVLILVGGADTVSFRLRVAQSHARQDLSPSSWSHVALMRNPARSFGNTSLYEISLAPSDGFGFPPDSNAIQTGQLKDYNDAKRYPNIAVLHVPASRRRAESAVKQFHMMRNVVNGVDGLARWLPYVWGASSATNPLFEEAGIPSAILVEYALAAADFDLTPGLASRASCPEAIWQTAKWWHEFFTSREEAGTADSAQSRAIHGSWFVGHRLIDLD